AVFARLRERDYDLVEFFGGEFGLVTWRLRRVGQRPFVVAHTDGFELLASEREDAYAPPRTSSDRLRRWFRRHAHDRLSRAAFTHADAFVTGCELDRKCVLELRMFAPERTAVVSPGVDEEYLGAREPAGRETRIAFTGSWIPRKGIRYVVETMNELRRASPELRLDLYGTAASAEAVLQDFAPEVRERVTVHGRLSNAELADGLSRAMVFLFPAQYEGFGMALAEAMACGCAPVTTPTGFGAELRDGKEALLCAFDDVGAMKRSVRALLVDSDLRSRVAAAARRRVAALSWPTQIGKLEATYASWLAQRAAHAGSRARA
ncbi:MAG TPA: glycosyltransferase family 4 protein, partial [Candidatus Polarisedimenticolaceae bacterium]|nr:glycosyltransferase family 4 protein [Candidatus Polarisedimenticolaceae bacterium]